MVSQVAEHAASGWQPTFQRWCNYWVNKFFRLAPPFVLIRVSSSSSIMITHINCPCNSHEVVFLSEGAVTHYKNRNNFVNLRYQIDFSIDAEWILFTSAQGKKIIWWHRWHFKERESQRSFQHPYWNQILTPPALFQFRSENIHEINTFNICVSTGNCRVW